MEGSRFTPPPLVDERDGEAWHAPTGKGGEVGGDRHYDGPTLGKVTVWRCPACGVDNVSDFDAGEGCQHCGSGKKGRHVGVDPMTATAAARQATAEAQEIPVKQTPWPAEGEGEGIVEQAFRVWFASAFTPGESVRTDRYEIAKRAFEVGWRSGAQHQAHAQQQEQPSAPAFDPDPVKKARRTVIAALRYFRDQVLTGLRPEDFAEGEWCTVQECDEVIAQIESEGL